MRIGIGDLEDARRNPVDFIRSAEAGEKPFIRSGYYSVLQNSILRFHKARLSEEGARSSMVEAYHRQFKTTAGLQEILDKFDEYVRQYRLLGHDTPVTRLPIRLRLPDDIKDDYSVTGQLPRLDISMQGEYSAWFFCKQEEDWESTLRLPLVQGAVAADLGVEPAEVAVGVFCFAHGEHIPYSFTETQITRAMSELCIALRQMQAFARGRP